MLLHFLRRKCSNLILIVIAIGESCPFFNVGLTQLRKAGQQQNEIQTSKRPAQNYGLAVLLQLRLEVNRDILLECLSVNL